MATTTTTPRYDGTFTSWMKKVDAEIARRTGGLMSDDLEDWRYRDAYEDDYTPVEAARAAIRYANGADE